MSRPQFSHISKLSKSGKGVRASGGSGAGWEERSTRPRDGGARSPLPSQALPPDPEPQPRPAPPCSWWESLTLECVCVPLFTHPPKPPGGCRPEPWDGEVETAGRAAGESCSLCQRDNQGQLCSSAVTAPGVCKPQTRSWCVCGEHQGVREFC